MNEAGTQRVVVQIQHPQLGAVGHSDGQSGPAFGADSWVGTQRELPQTCDTHGGPSAGNGMSKESETKGRRNGNILDGYRTLLHRGGAFHR